MTVARNAAGARLAGRKIAAALGVAGLLATLAACAGGNSASSLATPASATAVAPAAAPEAPAAAAPAPAATAAAAPKAAPPALTPTEVNEQCWMSTEANKIKDLDKKAKYVDKCVAEKTKAQGM